MSEEKRYVMKKVIDGNTIKYRRVEVTTLDIIAEKDLEIKRLHELIDTLREQITQSNKKNKDTNYVMYLWILLTRTRFTNRMIKLSNLVVLL